MITRETYACFQFFYANGAVFVANVGTTGFAMQLHQVMHNFLSEFVEVVSRLLESLYPLLRGATNPHHLILLRSVD
jgi:hypothetical protein